MHHDADLPARAREASSISRTGGRRDRPFVAAQAVPPWFCSAKMVSARARDLHGARDARCGDGVSSRARFSGDDRRGEEKPFVARGSIPVWVEARFGGDILDAWMPSRRAAPSMRCQHRRCGRMRRTRRHRCVRGARPGALSGPARSEVSTRERAVPRGVWREDRRDATIPSRVFRGAGHHPQSFDVPPPSACPSIARRPRTARGPPRHPRFPAPRVFSHRSPATA